MKQLSMLLLLVTAALPIGAKWKSKEEGTNSLAISPDGKTLAVACEDEKIRLVEVATGEVRHTAALRTPAWVPASTAAPAYRNGSVAGLPRSATPSR